MSLLFNMLSRASLVAQLVKNLPAVRDLPSVPEYDKVSQRVAELLLFSQPTEFSHSYL